MDDGVQVQYIGSTSRSVLDKLPDAERRRTSQFCVCAPLRLRTRNMAKSGKIAKALSGILECSAKQLFFVNSFFVFMLDAQPKKSLSFPSTTKKGRTHMRLTFIYCKIWHVWLLATLFAGVNWEAISQSTNGPVSVNRLVIQFTAGPTNMFQLLSKTTIIKTLSPSDQMPVVGRPLSGFWFELQDSIGGVRYRRFIDNPIRPAGSTGPAPAERVFSILVPTPANGDQLVLFSSPLIPGGESRPAQEVGRISFVTIN